MSARILILDIETSPNLGYFWSIWNQNIGLNQLEETTQVLSFAAKWRGQNKTFFYSDFNFETGQLDQHGEMIGAAWDLLDQADIVVHYNGTRFDIPHLNREFALAELTPPSPYKQVDLYRAAKRQFLFVSNKLDHVSRQLGVGEKVSHTGFELWKRCLTGDPKAWALMRRYNIGDVRITEKVYDRLLPWIANHPHVGLYEVDPTAPVCGRCSSGSLQRRGYGNTDLGRYQKFWCKNCGAWNRTAKRVDGVDLRPMS